MNLATLQTQIGKALGRIRLPFRAIINRTNSQTPHQLAQLSALAGETLPDVELMQHFGFSSAPPAGSKAVVLPLSGKTGSSIIIATENGGLRIKQLEEGEAVIYNARGDYVKLNKEGVCEVVCKKFKVTAPDGVEFVTPKCDVTGEVVAQEVKDQRGAKSMSGMRATFDPHSHKPGGPPYSKM